MEEPEHVLQNAFQTCRDAKAVEDGGRTYIRYFNFQEDGDGL